MTGPDILPHLGDLVLLALFIVGASSLGLAVWVQAGKIKAIEAKREADAAAFASLEDRVSILEIPEVVHRATKQHIQNQTLLHLAQRMNGAGKGSE